MSLKEQLPNPQALEELQKAEKHLEEHPPNWPKLTLTPTPSGYVAKGFTTYIFPLPEQLKADTVKALLDELIEPATEEAELLEACDLRYEAVKDWDGPGQIVGVVLSAPHSIYERLQDNKIYGNIISVMTTMVCENIGSDRLEDKQVEQAA